jgi:hypothetical protein
MNVLKKAMHVEWKEEHGEHSHANIAAVSLCACMNRWPEEKERVHMLPGLQQEREHTPAGECGLSGPPHQCTSGALPGDGQRGYQQHPDGDHQQG